jgi:hypothetical protein
MDKFMCHGKKERRRIIIIIIRRNGAKTISLQTLFGRLNYYILVACLIKDTEFHETLWSYRYMFLVGPKVFSFVVNGVKVIF